MNEYPIISIGSGILMAVGFVLSITIGITAIVGLIRLIAWMVM